LLSIGSLGRVHNRRTDQYHLTIHNGIVPTVQFGHSHVTSSFHVQIQSDSKLTRCHRAFFHHLPLQRRRLIVIPAIVAITYLISTAIQLKVYPTDIAFIFIFGFAVLCSAQQLQIEGILYFTWMDFITVLVCWLPLSLFFTFVISPSNTMTLVSYSQYLNFKWLSIVTTVNLVLTYTVVRPIIKVG
jgi:hypothetical protein